MASCRGGLELAADKALARDGRGRALSKRGNKDGVVRYA